MWTADTKLVRRDKRRGGEQADLHYVARHALELFRLNGLPVEQVGPVHLFQREDGKTRTSVFIESRKQTL